MTGAAELTRAAEISRLWGGCIGRPRLVAHRENAVFDVQLPQGRVALRLHRSGYSDVAAIETELAWTEALAGEGVRCPRPLRSERGRLCEMWDDQVASAVGWIDAPPVSHRPSADSTHLCHRLGQSLADLHAAADRLALCPVPRATWKSTDLLGPAPRWGGFWLNPALTDFERDFLLEVGDDARSALAALADPDVGLIHADALRENALDDGTRLWLIDFDDAGWGYRGYDLATALIQQSHLPGLPERVAALCEGYADRRPRAAPLAVQIPLFMVVRGLATAGWIVARAPAGDTRLRDYAERALTAARLFRGA